MVTKDCLLVLTCLCLALFDIIESRFVTTESQKPTRTRCKIYDQTSDTMMSQFCDALPENLSNGDTEEKEAPEFFCHAVWSRM